MPSPSNTASPAARALVVEPDETIRRRVSAGLREQGMEVSECGDVNEGRALYRGQRLVIAPLNGNNKAMQAFVAWVRAEAGSLQPWIIAMGSNHELKPGETPAHYGVNDLLTAPMDSTELVRRLESLGIGQLAEDKTPARKNTASDPPAPPSYHRAPVFHPRAWHGASAAVMLENFPAAVAILDRSMRYLAANQQWFSEFQLPASSLTGLSHYDLFPDLHPDWRQLYERCLTDHTRESSEDLLPRQDGGESLVRWEVLPWRESHGLIGGLVLTCTPARPETSPASGGAPSQIPAADPDAGETPDAAQISSTPAPMPGGDKPPSPEAPSGIDPAFREMAEAAPFGMVLLDDEARVLYANPQHKAVLGSGVTDSPDGLTGWLQRACPGDEEFRQQALDEWWDNVWRRHTPLTCSLRTAEGLVKEIEFRPAALSGDRLLLTIFDVTDARLDEQAVRNSEARHRGLFQQSSAAFAIMNAAGNLTEVNAAFETLTGCPKQEMRLACLADFLPEEAMRRLRPAEGAADAPFTSTLTQRSGKIIPVRIAVSVIRNPQGHPAFTACTLMPMPEGGSPATALPAVPIRIAAPAPEIPWAAVTPDFMVVLDAYGRVIQHNHPRDFESLVPAEARLQGQYLESALPLLTAPLPLDVMMERLLDTPGHEVRCLFPFQFPGETRECLLEARMILMATPESGERRFGLTLRDISASTSASAAPDPALPG